MHVRRLPGEGLPEKFKHRQFFANASGPTTIGCWPFGGPNITRQTQRQINNSEAPSAPRPVVPPEKQLAEFGCVLLQPVDVNVVRYEEVIKGTPENGPGGAAIGPLVGFAVPIGEDEIAGPIVVACREIRH